jgi:hypothetical protein
MAKSRFRQAKGYSAAIKKRTEQSSTGGYITIFKDNMNLPLYKEPKDGDVGMDIIPYLATDAHIQAKDGEHVYKLELWTHQMVGPEKGNYVCLRNFDEECPLCEARYEELASESPREDVAKSLKGSRRVIYNVVVDGESEKGVQIWTASTYLAEDPFKASAKNRKTGEKIPFACPDEGKTIWFTVQGSMLTKEFAGIDMEERPEPISDEILDQAFELEDCIIIPKAEELEKIARVVLGGTSDDGGEPDPPSKRRRNEEPSQRGRRSKPEPEDVPDKNEPEPEEEEAPSRRSKRDEPEDEAPPRKSRRSAPEDDGEEAPPRRTRRSTKSDDEEPPKRTRRMTKKD